MAGDIEKKNFKINSDLLGNMQASTYFIHECKSCEKRSSISNEMGI